MSHIYGQAGYYCNESCSKQHNNGQLTVGEKAMLIVGAYAVLAMIFFAAAF